jgi:hypothetical protein
MDDIEKLREARTDAAFMRNVAAGLTYNDTVAEAEHKHRLREIAMRIETGWYARAALATSASPSVVLTDERIEQLVFEVLRKAGDSKLWDALTYDSGPYDITKLSRLAFAICRAIERECRSSVPAGWKLVPEKPTPEMALRGADALDSRARNRAARYAIRDAWAAMLSAAPSLGEGEG